MLQIKEENYIINRFDYDIQQQIHKTELTAAYERSRILEAQLNTYKEIGRNVPGETKSAGSIEVE